MAPEGFLKLQPRAFGAGLKGPLHRVIAGRLEPDALPEEHVEAIGQILALAWVGATGCCRCGQRFKAPPAAWVLLFSEPGKGTGRLLCSRCAGKSRHGRTLARRAIGSALPGWERMFGETSADG